MWLTCLSSTLAVPRSAGSEVSDTGADWEPRGAALGAISSQSGAQPIIHTSPASLPGFLRDSVDSVFLDDLAAKCKIWLFLSERPSLNLARRPSAIGSYSFL